MPALDGMRALAVGAVLLFHGEVGVAPGGFLGVSMFFTLSGFLITTLLLVEHEATGTVALRTFFARRLRRLTPAAYLCILLVIAFGWRWNATQRQRLPGDVVASVLDVANWRFALAGTSYQDLFIGAPSPLAHFWSLAIEEQCYLLLPLLAWWGLRRGVRTFTVLVAGLLVLSITVTLLTSNRDLVYYGTHTRAAELLVGVLLALALRRWSVPDRWRGAIGTAGLLAVVIAVATVGLGDQWLYRGGLLAVAVPSSALIVGLTGRTRVAVFCAWRPLVAIGAVSYGIYLYHWPVFLLLSPAATGLQRWPLLVLRVAATTAVTLVSYRLLEQPVRHRRALATPGVALAAMTAAMAALLLAAAVALPAPRFTATEQLLAQGDEVVEFTADPATAIAELQPAPQPQVLVLGSDASPLPALRGRGWDVIDGVQAGCPVVTAVEVRLRDGTVVGASECEPSVARWRRLLAAEAPDVVVLSVGRLDAGVIRRAADPGFPEPGDIAEEGVRMLAADEQLRAATADLVAAGVPLVLFDAVPVGAAFDSGLDTIAVTMGLPQSVHRAVAGVVDSVAAGLVDGIGQNPEVVRLLVIGDSTSLEVAQALNDGSDGRLQVTWAGASGCPFVRAEATRPARDDPWRTLVCDPFDQKLPPLLDRFRPSAVLLVVSPMELVEQRYPGDPAPHVAGDAEFTAVHDAEMTAFVTMLAPYDVPLMVADSPALTPGGWATGQMTTPQRLDAWNAQVARWDAAWPQVTTFGYAGELAAFEAEHGSIRSDGVHPDVEPLTELARRSLVALLLDQLRPNSDL